ncbi:hypothetical protein EVG20_g8701 [Dentipellis fragilis]|uniref:Uncharacterized protein n=1 Tax=Dentipellis fragilis TaxID=205917 RepID=A0A4Y9Y5G3_9AGAM|nr:hypothetical protein EVG20_g8701 [Dentipellis fragilis]
MHPLPEPPLDTVPIQGPGLYRWRSDTESQENCPDPLSLHGSLFLLLAALTRLPLDVQTEAFVQDPRARGRFLLRRPLPLWKGPKLVYRTSSDEFVELHGPEAYTRLMKLICIDEDHELGKDGLWDIVRDQTVELLKSKGIKLSSVEFVRFTWLNEDDCQEVEDDSEGDDSQEDGNDLRYEDIPDIEPVEYGNRYTTPPTIWIGVLPDTLHAELAHETALEILGIFKQHNVSDVDVAFRESVAGFFHGPVPALFGPVSDLDALNDVVDNVSTPLSLPIFGLRTKMQGTLGFYFRVGNDLYAVTARHVLFNDDEGNTSIAGPKKEVVVMGSTASDNYVASIRAKIVSLTYTVSYLDRQAASYERRAEAEVGTPEAQKWAQDLKETERELTRNRTHIDTLKDFYTTVLEKWRNPKDRIIGYVDWAPPIAAVPPHRYTRDLCVIKLDKRKFKNFVGNVISLGPELSMANFRTLLYDRTDIPSEFWYPEEGLYRLRGILAAADINNPTSENPHGDLARRVLKHGSTTLTIVGTLSKYTSHPFARDGDSGALVVDALHRIAALLIGGTGRTESSDITFATLVEWVWVLVKDEYEGVDLYFEDLEAFLADVDAA